MNPSASKHLYYKNASQEVSIALRESSDKRDQRDSYDMYKCQSRSLVDHDRIIGARCRQRLCPLCQWRKQADLRREIIELIETTHVIHPFRWYSLTLTVENVPFDQTREAVKAMHSAFSRLMNYKEIKSGVSGYVRMTEIEEEKGREGYSNPHMHVIICVNSGFHRSNYISAKRWTALWRRANNNYKLIPIDRESWHPLREKEDKSSFDVQPWEIANAIIYGMKPLKKPYKNKKTGETVIPDLPSAEFLRSMNQQTRGITKSSWGGILKAEINRHRQSAKERKARVKKDQAIPIDPLAPKIMGAPTKYSNDRMIPFVYMPHLRKYVEEGFEHMATCFETRHPSATHHQDHDIIRYQSIDRCNESTRSRPSISPPITSQCPPPTVPIPKSDPCVKIPDNSKDIIPSTDDGVKVALSQPKSSVTSCSNSANDHCDEGLTFLSTQGTCEGIPEGVDMTDDESCVGRPKPKPFDVLEASKLIDQRRMESIRRMMKRKEDSSP
jgi:hypothetical protein